MKNGSFQIGSNTATCRPPILLDEDLHLLFWKYYKKKNTEMQSHRVESSHFPLLHAHSNRRTRTVASAPQALLSRISSPGTKLRDIRRCSLVQRPVYVVHAKTHLNLGFRLKKTRSWGNSSNGFTADRKSWVGACGEAISTGFPVWVALGCLLGLLKPSSFDWVQPKWTMMGITLTMLGMGMTLTFVDLCGALAMPKELFTGFLLQYTVMPLSGYFLSKLLALPSYYAAGLILVGCCPGGTASNIVTYIARGNVALSVLMTAASTLSAVVMTPFLTAKLAGQYVAVDAVGLLMSTLQVVLLPVLAGAFLNQYFQSLVKIVNPLMPPIAVATVAVLCGNAIAQSSSAILVSGRIVVVAAILLHTLGFSLGYVLSRMLGIDISSARTISIEVGMQNSVLGVVLATQHFGNPLTAVPCAVSSVCHSIIGSALAGVWRSSRPSKTEGIHVKPNQDDKEPDQGQA